MNTGIFKEGIIMQRCKVFEAKSSTSKKKNYENPPIPHEFEYVCGKWYSGFVIECKFDRSQFVWIPVGFLKANGTLDGKSFTEKFGRRLFKKEDEFSQEEFHETITEELSKQIESVKKYGGFYISRYCISRYSHSKEPMSVKGNTPLTSMDFAQAKMFAEWFDYCSEVSSHLMYGAEYDTVMEWIIESGVKTWKEVVQYSSDLGNYWNSSEAERSLAVTGSRRKWCVNNIFDLSGNVKLWTQERCGETECVLRGGSHYDDGISHPAVKRTPVSNKYFYYGAGFRVTLCLK